MTRSALHPQVTTFPPEVQDKLGVYVYRLIDPRNGETFYVGKGRGNRVFAHACAKVAEENLDPKLSRIRRIRAAGFEVGHVIHRHGMTDDIAVEVEAALIDAYPGLTNIAGGSGSGDYGVQHAAEVMERYAAQTAEITHRALLITVNQSIEDRSMYDAVRFAWKLDANKARGAELVMAVQKGLIRGVFVPERWLPASPKHLYRARASSDKGVGQRRALWISFYEVRRGLGTESARITSLDLPHPSPHSSKASAHPLLCPGALVARSSPRHASIPPAPQVRT